MRIGLDPRWRVHLESRFDLPMGAEAAWSELRDFPRFACQDVFHRSVRLERQPAAAGVPFLLDHGLLGFRVTRVGRILYWHEGRAYAFSDLSRHGSRRGFPHIYAYQIEPSGDDRCRVVLHVRGLWTATRLPRPLVRLWLGWIFVKTRNSVRNTLLRSALRAA